MQQDHNANTSVLCTDGMIDPVVEEKENGHSQANHDPNKGVLGCQQGEGSEVAEECALFRDLQRRAKHCCMVYL